VLVIDDEPAIGRSVRRLLKEHEVVAVTRVAEGLDLVHRAPFDVILCDLMMPEGTGIQFYEGLRATRPDLCERVVFLTGGAFTPGARDFLDAGRHVVIDKPFDVELLRAIVRECAARRT
jgi:DNA-binding NarL/FixJ family response regulator